MGIITISRELAALGDETAKELAKLLSYRFVDKYALEERMKSLDITGMRLEKYDERKPSLFASISEERDDYLHYLKQAVFAEAIEGDCIFMGRGAFALLEAVPGILPVFLVSSAKSRIERVKSYFGCDEKRARQIIAQSDHDRTGFHKSFFEKEWKDPDNYFLTLNTSILHPVACAGIIKNTAEYLFSGDYAAECERALREINRALQVVHHIRYERQIGVHFLEATVTGDSVNLFGVANSGLTVEAAVSAAKEITGIAHVYSDIQIVREYTPHPYKI